MSEVPAGQVYVRPELLFVESDRMHLESDTEHTVSPGDAVVLDLVFRGEGDFPQLCEQVAQLTSANAAEVAAHLQVTLRDPRSILELRLPVPIDRPDVIVCAFDVRDRSFDPQPLVRSLRRDVRVLQLGLGKASGGLSHGDAQFGTMKQAGHHRTLLDYVQWCRAYIRAANAVVVLVGGIDAILFGDLTDRVDAILSLSPSWPERSMLADMHGDRWIPDDPIGCTRHLMYALRFADEDDIAGFHRTTGSAFGMLEGYALRHAKLVVYRALDQRCLLDHIRRSPEDAVLGHACSTPRRWRRRSDARTLLVIASIEGGPEPLLRYLDIVLAIPAAERVFDDVLVATPGHWLRAQQIEGGYQLERLPGRTESHCVAAIALTGLLRDTATIFETMAAGVPTVLVPSTRPNPILTAAPPELLLPASSPAILAQLLADLAGNGNQRVARILRAQRALLHRFSATERAREMVQGRQPQHQP